MKLPPEIRSQIYTYLFHPYRVEIIRAQPPSSTKYRLSHRPLPPRDPQTQHTTCLPKRHHQLGNTARHAKQRDTKSKESGAKTRYVNAMLSLLFTTRTFHIDTLPILYANTQFVFYSPRAISRFLSTINTTAQAAIRHIELNHIMYNEPRLDWFRPFKLRSDMAWYIACDDLAVRLHGLEVLHVRLGVFDSPIRLEVGERWSLPVLVFGQRETRVRFARVKLQVKGRGREEVEGVERELESEITDPVAVEERLMKKLGGGSEGSVKAIRVLRLVFL